MTQRVANSPPEGPEQRSSPVTVPSIPSHKSPSSCPFAWTLNRTSKHIHFNRMFYLHFDAREASVQNKCSEQVFRTLRATFWPMRETATERKITDIKKLHNLYCLPVVIKVIRSRKIRWAAHVQRTGRTTQAYKILFRKYDGATYHLGDLKI
jgi:hypothetical protein